MNYEGLKLYINAKGLTTCTSGAAPQWGFFALVHGNGVDLDTVGEGHAWTRYRALKKALKDYQHQVEAPHGL